MSWRNCKFLQVPTVVSSKLIFCLYIWLWFCLATNWTAVGGTQDKPVISLVGAGATFPNNVYIAWMAAYRQTRLQFVDVHMSYDQRGSGYGKTAIMNQTGYGIAYAGSDSVLADSAYVSKPDLHMLPSLAGAAVLGYNLPGVKSLILTRDQVVGIYNGTITTWSDPTFVPLNPKINFPNASIEPVARLDSSGTTEMFTRALSSFSSVWAARYGIFSDPTGWNSSVVRTFGQRTTGMADVINGKPYRIGYLQPSSAIEVSLPYATLLNRRGLAVAPTAAAVRRSMEDLVENMTSRLTGVLVDSDNPNTYPIAGYTYLIVNLQQPVDCQTAIELVRYIDWLTTSEQAAIEANIQMMVAVSPVIAEYIRSSVLEKMTCEGGRPVMALVEKQIYDEQESLKTWKKPVEIVTPIVGTFIFVLVGLALRQRLQYLRLIDRDDWNINFFTIEIHLPKHRLDTNNGDKPKPAAKTTLSIQPANDNVTGNPDVHATPEMHRSHTNLSTKSSSTRLDKLKSLSAQNASTTAMHGTWNGHSISVKPLFIDGVFDVNRSVRYTLMRMREEISHENVTKFYGITMKSDGRRLLVEEYCDKRSLAELLDNCKYEITESCRFTIAADVANGMAFLHSRDIIHGALRTSVCLVDAHWTIKISDWQYVTMYGAVRRTSKNRNTDDAKHSILFHLKRQLLQKTKVIPSSSNSIQQQQQGSLESTATTSDEKGTIFNRFWIAPELCAVEDGSEMFAEPTRSGDVYSFGLIVFEIFNGKLVDEPDEGYGGGDNVSAPDIYNREGAVASKDDVEVGRSVGRSPSHIHACLSNQSMLSNMPTRAKQIMSLACSVDAIKRPTFEQLEKSLRSVTSGKQTSLIDSMIESIDAYACQVEEMLAESRRQNAKLSAVIDKLPASITSSRKLVSVALDSASKTNRKEPKMLRTKADSSFLDGGIRLSVRDKTPLLALRLRVGCTVDLEGQLDDVIDDLLNRFAEMVVGIVDVGVDVTCLERTSKFAVLACGLTDDAPESSVEGHFVQLARLALNSMIQLRNKSHPAKNGNHVSYSLIGAIHLGRDVCRSKRSTASPESEQQQQQQQHPDVIASAATSSSMLSDSRQFGVSLPQPPEVTVHGSGLDQLYRLVDAAASEFDAHDASGTRSPTSSVPFEARIIVSDEAAAYIVKSGKFQLIQTTKIFTEAYYCGRERQAAHNSSIAHILQRRQAHSLKQQENNNCELNKKLRLQLSKAASCLGKRDRRNQSVQHSANRQTESV